MAPSRRLELRGLVLLGAIGLGGAAMTPTPARQCQMVLDLWCAGDGECTRDVARDGDTVPLVARHNLPKLAGGVMAGWKCFSPSTLDKTEQRYVGGVDFCSRPVLANVLDICDGTNATAAAYPAPPQCTGGAGPTPSSGGDPGAPHTADDAVVMPAGMDGVASYRIPAIVGPFPPHSAAVLVFAEAREASSSDSGKHALAMRRSSDGGKNGTWEPTLFLYNDTDPAKDGLNLGAAVYDNATRTVFVLFNECADKFGKAPCGPTAELLLKSSADFGSTWSPVTSLTSVMVAAGYAMLNPGPGTGIQLAITGRLVVPAWGPQLGERDYTAVALLSDDHGRTWRVSKAVPTPAGAGPNELMAAALPGGEVVLNARDAGSHERLISRSLDGGETWAAFVHSPSLSATICQGSTVAIGGTLFYSHPFDQTVRSNGWIKFSTDAGASWWLWRQVDPGPFGYSALTVVTPDPDVNGHITLGIVYEGTGGLRWTVISDALPSAATATTVPAMQAQANP